MFSKHPGLDYEHAKLALRELARYHALGMALRKHNPKVYEVIAKNKNEIPFDVIDEEFEQMAENILDVLIRDPRIAPYKDRMRKSVIRGKDYVSVFKIDPVEPYVTINHGDFWVNNIMFHHGETKFIKVINNNL